MDIIYGERTFKATEGTKAYEFANRLRRMGVGGIEVLKPYRHVGYRVLYNLSPADGGSDEDKEGN